MNDNVFLKLVLSLLQLLVELAFELTLGQLSVMMDCPSKAVAHWLQAIVMCHSVWNMDIARGIFSLILPEGKMKIKFTVQIFFYRAPSQNYLGVT